MKKIFTLVSAAMMIAGSAYAQDDAEVVFGNPKDGNGMYIVQYDLDNQKWAESNNWSAKETFVFAVDIEGTRLFEEIANAQASPAEGVKGYGIGFHAYPTNVMVDPESAAPGNTEWHMRLFHIQDGIYGCVLNPYQWAQSNGYKTYSEGDETRVDNLAKDFVTNFGADVFIYAWSDKSAGYLWWNGVAEPISNFQFCTGPNNPEINDPEFWWEDVVPADKEALPGLPNANFGEVTSTAGYLPATIDYLNTALGNNAIRNVDAADAEVVAVRYFDLQGRQLTLAPVNGLFIQQNVMSNGAVKAFKVVK